MARISTLAMNGGLRKTDDDVIECVSIHGTLVDLRNVSPILRDQWRAASRRVGKAEQAKSELQRVGQAILAEQAIKSAPVTRGDHAVMAKLRMASQ
jgi:hypothetical protein